jgi:hypothetical protein
VAQERVLNRRVPRLQGEFDPLGEPLHLCGEFPARFKAHARFRLRGLAGACNPRGDGGENGAATEKDHAGAQEPDLKNRC